MSRDEQSQLVGAGWSTVDADAGGPYRWMIAAQAPWQDLRPGWHDYEWDLPEGLVRPGPIEAAIIVDALPAPAGDDVPRAIAIAEIRLLAR